MPRLLCSSDLFVKVPVMGIVLTLVSIASFRCSEEQSVKQDFPPVVLSLHVRDSSTISFPTQILADVVSSAPIVRVNFLVDNVVIASDSLSPYSYLWDPLPWADSRFHVISAKATDSRGRVGESAKISVFLPLGPPLPPLLLHPPAASLLQISQSTPFRWTRTYHSVAYEVEVREGFGMEATIASGVFTDTTCTLQLSQGPLSWKVRAKNVEGVWGPWSDSSRFGYGVFSKAIAVSDPVHEWLSTLIERPDSGFVAVSYFSLSDPNERITGLIGISPTGAVQWERTFNGIQYRNIERSSMGGYVLIGSTVSPVTQHWAIAMMKTSETGSAEWARLIDDSTDMYPGKITRCADNGFVVAGTQVSSVQRMMLFRFDASGTLQWKRTIGDSAAGGVSASQTPDGGFIALGIFTPSSGSFTPDLFLAKTDAAGTLVWQRSFSERFAAYDGMGTPDGGFVSVGYRNPGMFWHKANSSGQEEWRYSYLESWPGGATLTSVAGSHEGDMVVAGSVGVNGNAMLFLARIDNMGTIVWQRQLAGDGGEKVIRTMDGGYCIAQVNRRLTKTNGQGFSFSP